MSPQWLLLILLHVNSYHSLQQSAYNLTLVMNISRHVVANAVIHTTICLLTSDSMLPPTVESLRLATYLWTLALHNLLILILTMHILLCHVIAIINVNNPFRNASWLNQQVPIHVTPLPFLGLVLLNSNQFQLCKILILLLKIPWFLLFAVWFFSKSTTRQEIAWISINYLILIAVAFVLEATMRQRLLAFQ